MSTAATNDAVNLIIGRASPIKISDAGPDAAETDRIMAAGLRAPDHGGLKPWKFMLVRGDARQRFGELLAQSLSRRQPDAPQESLGLEAAKALRAPLLIIAAATPRTSSKVPVIEQVMATAAAVQNMMIAAHALGYGALWRTGPAAYDRDLMRTLGLADADQIVGFVYVGGIALAGKSRAPQPAGAVEVWEP